ncbi:MAG: DUF2220 family protein [Rouxiella aceris]|nr:DUF2220 family protein [Rouxiella aceris]
MKSPEELAERLAKQWRHSATRQQRLLSVGEWPLRLPIGRPSAQMVRDHFLQVRTHLDCWQGVCIGNIIYASQGYQSLSHAIDLPQYWQLTNAREWVAATGDAVIESEYTQMMALIAETDLLFHSLLIGQPRLWRGKPLSEVIKAAELALWLEANIAQGLPLRALPYPGIDSKFIERHRGLLIALLDVRFQKLVSTLGLEIFLGAENNNNHWLLVADLAGDLLPLPQIRVRDSDLFTLPLPGQYLIIVENERCLHQLPRLPHTLVILGAGLNLAWMAAQWLAAKTIAYWGDIDTWGLTMLARARQHQPGLTALLMNEAVYNDYAPVNAVAEPQSAAEIPPCELTAKEQELYLRLLRETNNRLEQEFLPVERVKVAVEKWFLARSKKK